MLLAIQAILEKSGQALAYKGRVQAERENMQQQATINGFSNLFKTEKPEDKRLKSGEIAQVNELIDAKVETRIATLEKQVEVLSNEYNTAVPKLTQRIYLLEQKHQALSDFSGQIHNLDMAMIADIGIIQQLIQKLKDLSVLEPEYPMPNPRRQRIEPMRPPPALPSPYAPEPVDPGPTAPEPVDPEESYAPSAPPE
jgi:archaellum component FlaC